MDEALRPRRACAPPLSGYTAETSRYTPGIGRAPRKRAVLVLAAHLLRAAGMMKIFALVFALAALAISPHLPGTVVARGLSALVLFAAGGVFRRAGPAAHALFVAGLLALAVLVPLPWPGGAVLAVAAYLLVDRTWLRRGALTPRVLAAIVPCVALPAVGLLGWFVFAEPDLAQYRAYEMNLPRALVWAGIPLWAALNAAVEEAIWRGTIMEATDDVFGPGWASVVVQAVGFGLWHYKGFPSGWAGVVLTAGFSLMMGALRRWSRGMLAPWLAHACADTTIGCIVLAHL